MRAVDELLKTELTRREFLTRVGLAVLALTGIPALLKSFGGISDTPSTSATSYGGHADSAQYRTLN